MVFLIKNEKSAVSTIGIAGVESIESHPEIKRATYFLLNEMKKKDLLKIPVLGQVMIKPNICLVRSYETGATVDPYLVKCLVDWLLENYDLEKIYIGESDATMLNLNSSLQSIRLG